MNAPDQLFTHSHMTQVIHPESQASSTFILPVQKVNENNEFCVLFSEINVIKRKKYKKEKLFFFSVISSSLLNCEILTVRPKNLLNKTETDKFFELQCSRSSYKSQVKVEYQVIYFPSNHRSTDQYTCISRIFALK